MPLYEYRCRSGHLITKLRSYANRKDSPVCSCGQTTSIIVSAPARTSYRWGDTKWDGFKDRATGVTYRDQKHREAVMRKKGLRELEPGEVEAEQRRVMREHEAHEQNIKTFQNTLEETGSAQVAMERTFPTPEIT
jgi:putative FmdB family regulatory protein